MDPISQGVLGAALPQAVADPKKIRTITWLGCLSGMAPDIDVFIRSPTDPILFLEFHRQFTHALSFIPIGALICAFLFYRFAKAQLSFKQTYIVCLLGYLTHGLLDACTTYGTQLFWPFSDTRVAWNNVSVVDPFFTVPILILVILTYRTTNLNYSRIALVWGLAYLLLGVVQRDRAEALAWKTSEDRGHYPARLEAKPGFGSLLLWKVVYEYEGHYYVDAYRMTPTPKYFEGEHIKKFSVAEDLPWLDMNSQQADDLRRFDWFSNNYLAVDPTNSLYIIDVRYSMLPNEIKPLWGIEFDRDAAMDEHVKYRANRSRPNDMFQKIKVLFAD